MQQQAAAGRDGQQPLAASGDEITPAATTWGQAGKKELQRPRAGRGESCSESIRSIRSDSIRERNRSEIREESILRLEKTIQFAIVARAVEKQILGSD